jgi:hypothetical protein
MIIVSRESQRTGIIRERISYDANKSNENNYETPTFLGIDWSKRGQYNLPMGPDWVPGLLEESPLEAPLFLPFPALPTRAVLAAVFSFVW